MSVGGNIFQERGAQRIDLRRRTIFSHIMSKLVGNVVVQSCSNI